MLQRFLGWSRRAGVDERVALAEVEAALGRYEVQGGLREIVEILIGPLEDRRAERARARAAEDELWQSAAADEALRGRPELSEWLGALRAEGLLSRAAAGAGRERDTVLRDALAVVGRLPASGVLLAVLAADATGDPHALDRGRPLTGLVLRAAARLCGWSEVPPSAQGRRLLWAEAGVLCDPLSSDVLVLGLRPEVDGALPRRLREAAAAGEPQVLTLRELERSPLRLPPSDLYVCENPSVIAAAADRHGAACAPLVCTDGMPSTAVLRLLRMHAGRLRCHADFDWNGLRIANFLVGHHGALPWRFETADYEEALRGGRDAVPLEGRPVAARWDEALGAAMAAAGRAIFEESVLERLLRDLAPTR